MDDRIVRQVLDELLPSIEAIEARSAAVLQFLKDKGIATEEDLAPYIQQAGKGAGVRWLATRARIEFLLSSAIKDSERKAEEEKASKYAATQGEQDDAGSTAESSAKQPESAPSQAEPVSTPDVSSTQPANAPAKSKDPKEPEGSAA